MHSPCSQSVSLDSTGLRHVPRRGSKAHVPLAPNNNNLLKTHVPRGGSKAHVPLALNYWYAN